MGEREQVTAFKWTQPCCENCWWRNNEGIPHPISAAHREPEVCVFCGASTLSGIYVRTDPSTARFPTRTK